MFRGSDNSCDDCLGRRLGALAETRRCLVDVSRLLVRLSEFWIAAAESEHSATS